MQNTDGLILALETSCDECSASVVQHHAGRVRVLSNVIFSQIELHRKYGGVVPEVASRNHLEMLSPVVQEALENAKASFDTLSAIAVTQGPGLIGALLVGVSAAKAMAYARGLPLIAVNHLQGHLHSLFIEGQSACENLSAQNLPLLVCLVSGGHTSLYVVKGFPPNTLDAQKICESRDDAAGEAFDKSAKLLGLPYPGGILIDKLAKQGNKKAFAFPRPLKGKTLEFSFSGLKTAVATEIKKLGFEPHIWGNPDTAKLPQGQLLHDLCASVQEAIVDSLIEKMKLGLKQERAKGLAIVGGVSANSRLRERLSQEIKVPVFFPDLQYCTDNAAMIGAAAVFQQVRSEALSGDAMLKLNAFSG